MESRRLASRLAALVLEAVLGFGILASTWLVVDELLGPGWAPRLVRTYAEGGRQLGEDLGIVEEPETIVILDPVPTAPPRP